MQAIYFYPMDHCNLKSPTALFLSPIASVQLHLPAYYTNQCTCSINIDHAWQNVHNNTKYTCYILIDIFIQTVQNHSTTTEQYAKTIEEDMTVTVQLTAKIGRSDVITHKSEAKNINFMYKVTHAKHVQNYKHTRDLQEKWNCMLLAVKNCWLPCLYTNNKHKFSLE